jgi:hypothetical protein
MQTASELAIKRVMYAYGLLVRLSVEEERALAKRSRPCWLHQS